MVWKFGLEEAHQKTGLHNGRCVVDGLVRRRGRTSRTKVLHYDRDGYDGDGYAGDEYDGDGYDFGEHNPDE